MVVIGLGKNLLLKSVLGHCENIFHGESGSVKKSGTSGNEEWGTPRAIAIPKPEGMTHSH